MSDDGVTGTPRRPQRPANRWLILGASTLAQAVSAISIHGPAFLIPELRASHDLSLAQAGLVASAPIVGVLATLVLWGLVVDRIGERTVLVTGLVGMLVAGLVSVVAPTALDLALALGAAGAFGASMSSASGRVVVGWFPAHQRGTAMGIRQMAQPIGVGIAAVSIAGLASAHGLQAALWVGPIGALLGLALVLAFVIDPARPPRTTTPSANPYRGDLFLQRIHGVSILLVVPQFVVWTYALVWLIDDRGWEPAAAGLVVGVAQVAGALGRIAVGALSDRVGSRMRPLRWVATAAVATMALLGLTAWQGWSIAVAMMVVATTVTVADNGLAFTSVAERAGPYWSGRALGLQNTGQFLTAALVPPVAGFGITHLGYPATFALAGLFAAVAIGLVPVREESAFAEEPLVGQG